MFDEWACSREVSGEGNHSYLQHAREAPSGLLVLACLVGWGDICFEREEAGGGSRWVGISSRDLRYLRVLGPMRAKSQA